MRREADTQLVSLILEVARLAKGWMRSHNAAPPGAVSHVRLATLAFIEAEGRPAMKDLADRLCVTAPSATLLVNGLASQGLIRRVTSAGDRRAVRLALTPKGKRALAQGTEAMRQRIGIVIGYFTPPERRQLKAMLSRLLRTYRPSSPN